MRGWWVLRMMWIGPGSKACARRRDRRGQRAGRFGRGPDRRHRRALFSARRRDRGDARGRDVQTAAGFGGVSGQVEALIAKMIADARAANPHRPALIGVGGAQGSGKTTLCSAFANAHDSVAHFSLDDIYLTRAERVTLAGLVNSLLLTRADRRARTISTSRNARSKAKPLGATRLPRFDKARDDRAGKRLAHFRRPRRSDPDRRLVHGRARRRRPRRR